MLETSAFLLFIALFRVLCKPVSGHFRALGKQAGALSG